MPSLPDPLPPQVVQALARGNKVEAINLLSEIMGWNLRETLKAIKQIEADESLAARFLLTPSTTRASQQAAGNSLAPGETKRSGSLIWLALALALAAIVVYLAR